MVSSGSSKRMCASSVLTLYRLISYYPLGMNVKSGIFMVSSLADILTCEPQLRGETRRISLIKFTRIVDEGFLLITVRLRFHV